MVSRICQSALFRRVFAALLIGLLLSMATITPQAQAAITAPQQATGSSYALVQYAGVAATDCDRAEATWTALLRKYLNMGYAVISQLGVVSARKSPGPQGAKPQPTKFLPVPCYDN
jgi:hypothetical protein